MSSPVLHYTCYGPGNLGRLRADRSSGGEMRVWCLCLGSYVSESKTTLDPGKATCARCRRIIEAVMYSNGISRLGG